MLLYLFSVMFTHANRTIITFRLIALRRTLFPNPHGSIVYSSKNEQQK